LIPTFNVSYKNLITPASFHIKKFKYKSHMLLYMLNYLDDLALIVNYFYFKIIL
jgi:hypothetical protein